MHPQLINLLTVASGLGLFAAAAVLYQQEPLHQPEALHRVKELAVGSSTVYHTLTSAWRWYRLHIGSVSTATWGLCVLVGTRRVLRVPVLLLIVLAMVIEITAYVLLRLYVRSLERFIRPPRKSRELVKQLYNADNYQQWQQIAQQLDRVEHRDEWKLQPESRYYDARLVQRTLEQLRKFRQQHERQHRHQPTGSNGVSPSRQSRSSQKRGKSPRARSKSQRHASISNRQHEQDKLDDSQSDASKHSSTDANAALHADHALDELLSLLSGAVTKNLFGTLNEQLYSKTLCGTKRLIINYVDELCSAIEYVAEYSQQLADQIRHTPEAAQRRTLHQQLGETQRIMQAIRLSYGQSALCLSGGASCGNFHWGLIKALLEGPNTALPTVISGTSAGAVVCALIGTRTDQEVRDLLNVDLVQHLNSFNVNHRTGLPNSWFRIALHYIRHGVMFDERDWHDKIEWFGRGMTFLEAYRHTGRIISITCTSSRKHSPPMLLNYITAPHVTIASAVIASVAVPTFVKPQHLMEKVRGKVTPMHGGEALFTDGSISLDIPGAQLSELFGCSFFIVSQVNPHIIPFWYSNRGEAGKPSIWRRRFGSYRGGFFLSAVELWLKEDLRKNMRVLNGLDLLPSIMSTDWSTLFLQQFEGNITLAPSPTWYDYLTLMSDPQPAQFERMLREGRLMTYEKMSQIQIRTDIQRAIETAVKQIDKLVAEVN